MGLAYPNNKDGAFIVSKSFTVFSSYTASHTNFASIDISMVKGSDSLSSPMRILSSTNASFCSGSLFTLIEKSFLKLNLFSYLLLTLIL